PERLAGRPADRLARLRRDGLPHRGRTRRRLGRPVGALSTRERPGARRARARRRAPARPPPPPPAPLGRPEAGPPRPGPPGRGPRSGRPPPRHVPLGGQGGAPGPPAAGGGGPAGRRDPPPHRPRGPPRDRRQAVPRLRLPADRLRPALRSGAAAEAAPAAAPR